VRRLVLILALLSAPPALAEGLRVDPAVVQDCYRSAAAGEDAPRCLGAASNACQALPGGATTVGIAECIGDETAVWDRQLNRAYKALQTRYKARGDGLSKALRDAQRAWITFRDAQCRLDYQRWAGGTIRTIVAANCQLTMTAGRALALRDMGETP
jgi:uncharacterized protein YecT (DUF1311 family)